MKAFLIGVLVFSCASSISAQAKDQDTKSSRQTIVDYFLLLPRDCFETPPAGWLTVIQGGNGTIDKKNGYMSCGGDGAQPEFEVALFRHRDGRPLLAISSGELEGPDSVYLQLFELGVDGKMHGAKRSMFPVADSKDDRWQFELPREGRSILVRARKGGKILHKITWTGEQFAERE